MTWPVRSFVFFFHSAFPSRYFSTSMMFPLCTTDIDLSQLKYIRNHFSVVKNKINENYNNIVFHTFSLHLSLLMPANLNFNEQVQIGLHRGGRFRINT